MATPIQARSALGNTIKNHPGDHEAIAAARRDLGVAKLEAHIRQVAESAPPPTPEQAARLRALLPVPSAGDGDAA
jgi:hypothetical protein